MSTRLVSDTIALVVRDSARVTTAHGLSAIAALMVIAMLLLIAVLARSGGTGSEAAAIRRRYAPLLIPIERTAIPDHRPVV